MKHIFFVIAIFLALSIACIATFYGHIATFIFARLNDVDISYGRLSVAGPAELGYKNLSIVWRSRGIGLSAENAHVKMIFDSRSALNPASDFVLNDFCFVTRGAKDESSYSNVDGLILVPLCSMWKYKKMSGLIAPIKNGVSVKNLVASGDEIRFSFDGTLTENDLIDADVSIYFSNELMGKIPPELSNMVLKEETGGWRSLTMKLKGDLAKPSISITGRLFRLNIGLKSDNPSDNPS